MSEYDYFITITKTGTGKETKITGNLTCTFSEYDTTSDFLFIPKEESFSLDFNPLTILGDLRCEKISCEYTKRRAFIDRSWEYWLGACRHEYGFEIPLYIGNDYRYIKLMSYLDEITYNNKCITIKELEEIQNKYNLELNCEISAEENDISFALLQSRGKNAKEKTYVPLKYEVGKANKDLLQNTYMNKNHCFSYQCSTMVDVIFAILHFIVMHQYEFKICALCQKLYVKIPNHGQGKFCSRKSPLGSNSYFDERTNKKFKDLDCQKSMKIFHQIMRNRKKIKLRHAPDEEQENTFRNKFDNYNDKIKNVSIVENLIKFYYYVEQYEFQI